MSTIRRTPLGYHQFDPLPSDEELREFYAKKYYQEGHSQYAAQYDDEEKSWFRLDAKVADLVYRERGGTAPRRVLDVGCGEGFFLAGLEELGWEVAGCDFSAHGITHFHPHLVDRFEAGNIYDLLERYARERSGYGLVNLSNVLEHVRDPEALLQRVRPLLAPGGMFRLNVPNDFSVLQQELLRRGKVDREYWIAPFEHLNYFDAKSIVATVESAGLTPVITLGDFPIEHFLLHDGSNYVKDRTVGKQAHRARVALDLLYARRLPEYVRMLEAQAGCDVGRSIILFAA